jgi:PAS domain S-box-containing protein
MPSASSNAVHRTLRLCRVLLRADLVVAVQWVREDTVRVLDSFPDPLPVPAFSLSRARVEAAGGLLLEMEHPRALLGSALRTGLPGTPTAVLAVAFPETGAAAEAPEGGMLAVWLHPAAADAEAIRRSAPEVRAALAEAMGACHAEVVLEGMAGRLSAVLGSVPQAVIFMDDTGSGHVNAPAARLLRVPAGPVAAHRLAVAMGALRSRACNRVEVEARAVELFADPHFQVRDWTWEFDRPAPLHLAVSSRPVHDGRVRGRIWVLDDVTAERRSRAEIQRREREFRTLAENARDIIARLGPDLRYRYVNPAVERITGVAPDALLNRTDAEAWAGSAHIEARERALRDVLADGEVRTLESRIDSPLGPVHLQTRLALEPSLLGAAESVLEITRDVTEQKRLAEHLQQAMKMEAVGRLAGGVAHDFNNQLTGVIGFAGLLRMEVPDNSESRLYVDEIARAATRAAELTRQLLAFARRQILQPREIDTNEVVRGMDPLLRRLLDRGIELRTRAEAAPGAVEADPSQLEQILVALVANARDAVAPGGRITVVTRNVVLDTPLAGRPAAVPPGHYVVVAVEDDGHGMDEATQERIFEPFFTTRPQCEATGLGLSMVLGIVQQSGCHLAVRSAPGRGSSFEIYLPALLPSEPAPQPLPAHRVPDVRGTVLLVDDEAAVRNLARIALTRAGYSVLQAADGEEALRVWVDNRDGIDLVVTDLTMPRMGGLEFGRRLADDGKRIPVVYMSGYSSEIGDAEHPYAAGFLTKPFTPGELVGQVAAALRGTPA